MPTQRKPISFAFQGCQGRTVTAAFNGGTITSHAGALLLRESGRAMGLFDRVAACFTDHRDPALTEHSVATMVAQRIVALALGYEDLNDHDHLRHDPVLGLLGDRTGGTRKGCAALAGKSTLNRLEHAPEGEPGRYHRIGHDPRAMQALLTELFIESKTGPPPARLVLDIDCTDDAVHGRQEGRFFHGYYGHYCFLPLYVFCGHHPLAAVLRPGNTDPARGAVEELDRIVTQLRDRWPDVELLVRADSAYAREEIMAFCEARDIHYVLGLARNDRLRRRIAPELLAAKVVSEGRGRPARLYTEFAHATRTSWSRARRVVAKCEHIPGKSNPRFVVTSLPETIAPRTVYERIYCPRGNAENAIKEQQLDLFAGRTSATPMAANQLRLLFSALASVLMIRLRAALAHTRLARATAHSLRLKLLGIGARVSVSVRRVAVAMDAHHPFSAEFARVHASFPT